MDRSDSRNPLAPPSAASEALALFAGHFGIAGGAERDPVALIGAVSRAFARIPYENLSKIVRFQEADGAIERARRGPLELVTEHVRHGAGGTCFSLTAALLHVLRALGFRAEPILADRKYGADTHCALLVWIGGAPRLIDPGYLLVDPAPLGSEETRVPTAFNEVRLLPHASGERVDLYTVQQGHRTYRLTFKTSPVDDAQFLAAWDASFDWDMMRYPVLTRVDGKRQLYLQQRRVQVRELESVSRREVSDEELLAIISREFGIAGELARRALSILKRSS